MLTSEGQTCSLGRAFTTYGIFQGLFVDLYFILRGKNVFARGGVPAIIDGLIMGALRAVPAVTMQSAILGPYLEGETRTLTYILLYSLFNLIGNGVEAGISAPFAIRIARSVSGGGTAGLVEQPAVEVPAEQPVQESGGTEVPAEQPVQEQGA